VVRCVHIGLIGLVLALAPEVVSGQQPKNRKAEPYVAPLLPAEQAWLRTLPAAPAAAAVMDDYQVYVPLQKATTIVEGEIVPVPNSATIAAVDRDTGVTRWLNPIESTVAPALSGGMLFIAAGKEVHGLDALTGVRQWRMTLENAVRSPMLVRGSLLIALTEPDQLVAIRIDTREIAWRLAIAETGPVQMNADARTIVVTTAGGRALAVSVGSGMLLWDRTLKGSLSEAAIDGDRVFIGAGGPNANDIWALDAQSGKDKWHWPGRIFGGDVIGAAVEGDRVFVASLDNFIRALDRDDGSQLWKRATGRPVLPPRAFFGTVVVVGLSPTVATFHGFDTRSYQAGTPQKTAGGTPISTWAAPAEAELLGPPLIDQDLKPFRVAMVVLMQDGRMVGLRPTAMMFKEPVAVPLSVLPGRALPRERLPGDDSSRPAN
jgi:outer membrane protein assembly factor BamB